MSAFYVQLTRCPPGPPSRGDRTGIISASWVPAEYRATFLTRRSGKAIGVRKLEWTIDGGRAFEETENHVVLNEGDGGLFHRALFLSRDVVAGRRIIKELLAFLPSCSMQPQVDE